MSTTTVEDDRLYPAAEPPARPSRVSWGAILVGALLALVTTAGLHLLGVGVGMLSVDAVEGDTPSAGTFAAVAGVWMLVAHLIGLAFGGYAAARLANTGDGTVAGLHGLGVWATAALVSATLLGNLAAGAASGAAGLVGNAFGGLARGAQEAAGAAAEQANPEQLVERARLALTRPEDPARMNAEQRAAEIASLVGRRITEGDLPGPDRDRLARIVAAEAGIAPQEAQARIQRLEAEAQARAAQAERAAREAANTAATGVATAALWLFGTLLLGALAAWFGARAGRRGDGVSRVGAEARTA